MQLCGVDSGVQILIAMQLCGVDSGVQFLIVVQLCGVMAVQFLIAV